MAKKFSELRAKMSPEAQARAAARAEAMLVQMQLQELRKARKVTQVEVAKAMSVEQAAVSKLERRDDMYVSTLRKYVKALGGEVQLVASFPDPDIQVHPFKLAHRTRPTSGGCRGNPRRHSLHGGQTVFPSEPHFLLVAHSEDRDGAHVDAVAHHIAAVAEIDQPFPELVGHVLDGTADTGLMSKSFHPLPHGLRRTFGGVDVFWRKEAIKALHIEQRRL